MSCTRGCGEYVMQNCYKDSQDILITLVADYNHLRCSYMDLISN